MQPGYPGSGQDPYGQQPPYSDPYAQPQYPAPQQPPQDPPQQPPTPDPYAQPQPPPYGDPYGQHPQQPYGYPPGQYPMPGYGPPGVPPQPNNTLGLVGMILGIVSIPVACCAIVGLLTGGAGVVLGSMGLRKVAAGQATNRGQALAAVICGAVGLVLSIISGAYGAVNFADLTAP